MPMLSMQYKSLLSSVEKDRSSKTISPNIYSTSSAIGRKQWRNGLTSTTSKRAGVRANLEPFCSTLLIK